MNIDKIILGSNAPEEFNVVIEIPANSSSIKYELDKESGALFVDRIISTPMFYPCNYGFLPSTLGKDGDPLDALVLTETPLMPGSVINSRPVGVIIMEDEKGMDEKIICVPIKKVSSLYDNIITYKDLPKLKLKQISHFFERYKDLEEGKWVKISGFGTLEQAKVLVNDAVNRYNK